MSKTAEEILKEELVASGITMWIWDDVNKEVMPIYVSAMKAFAAQEVEAYKERLKAEIDRYPKITLYYSAEAIKLIDTVK